MAVSGAYTTEKAQVQEQCKQGAHYFAQKENAFSARNPETPGILSQPRNARQDHEVQDRWQKRSHPGRVPGPKVLRERGQKRRCNPRVHPAPQCIIKNGRCTESGNPGFCTFSDAIHSMQSSIGNLIHWKNRTWSKGSMGLSLIHI